MLQLELTRQTHQNNFHSVLRLVFKAEEWPTNPDDFLDSIFKLEDNQFNLIDNDLDAIPSSSSDSGLSSALSLSCEQQLSPLLPIEEDQLEISNSELSSPQDVMDFDSLGSPIQSMASVDSPVRSVVSSNIGSPATDVAEEMDVEHTLVAVVNPTNTLADANTTIVTEQPVLDLGKNNMKLFLSLRYIQHWLKDNTFAAWENILCFHTSTITCDT